MSIAEITPATLEYLIPPIWNSTPAAVAELMAALPASLEALAIGSK